MDSTLHALLLTMCASVRLRASVFGKTTADLKTNRRASLQNDECVERVSRELSRANERKLMQR